MLASGASGSSLIDADSDNAALFSQAINEVCLYLAQSIVRDGEGATKFVSVNVASAATLDEARDVAYTIAHSPLVKTALFASDPNWGRILAAVGRAGIENLVLEDVSIYLDDVCIVSGGCRAACEDRPRVGKPAQGRGIGAGVVERRTAHMDRAARHGRERAAGTEFQILRYRDVGRGAGDVQRPAAFGAHGQPRSAEAACGDGVCATGAFVQTHEKNVPHFVRPAGLDEKARPVAANPLPF